MKGQTVKDFIMTVRDVSELLNRSRRSVYHVMRRYPDFPEPMARGRGNMMLWLKADMLAWYEIHKDELMRDLQQCGRYIDQK